MTLEQRAPDLSPLADALRELAPELVWRQRSSDDPVFMDGHANAAIVGPGPMPWSSGRMCAWGSA
jgi:hypothetical protein